jgi:NAD(P)-dependent dehydrogenase (short-subunit alcohol dehydrogenase family)
MKVAITGHSRGIGQAIAQMLSQEHNIVGMSRSNGFDVSNVDSVVAAAADCDVFINNAYSGLAQVEILKKLHSLWQDKNRLIINIGSTVTDYPRSNSQVAEDDPWPYRDHKKLLASTFRQLTWNQTSPCRLALVTPGATDTDMIRHLTLFKIPPQEIANAVLLVINNPSIKEITVYRTN